MYSYVTNNPLTYTDRTGLGFWSGLGNLLGAFLGIYDDYGGLGLPAGLPGGGEQVWNEQPPIFGGVSSGVPLNTGTVWGSGQAQLPAMAGVYGTGQSGPFIFSDNFAAAGTYPLYGPIVIDPAWGPAVVNFIVTVFGRTAAVTRPAAIVWIITGPAAVRAGTADVFPPWYLAKASRSSGKEKASDIPD